MLLPSSVGIIFFEININEDAYQTTAVRMIQSPWRKTPEMQQVLAKVGCRMSCIKQLRAIDHVGIQDGLYVKRLGVLDIWC